MATLEEMIRGFGTVRSSETEIVVDPEDDGDAAIWRGPLRLPGPGESFEDVLRDVRAWSQRREAGGG